MGSFSIWHWLVVAMGLAVIVGPAIYCARLAKKKGPTGVAGWLAWLVLSFAVSPLVIVGMTASQLGGAEIQSPALVTSSEWGIYKAVSWTLALVMSALFIVAAWNLGTDNQPSAVRFAKWSLWAAPAAVVVDAATASYLFGGGLVDESITGLIRSTIVATIWTAYLSLSKRVRGTYYQGEAFRTPADTPSPAATLVRETPPAATGRPETNVAAPRSSPTAAPVDAAIQVTRADDELASRMGATFDESIAYDAIAAEVDGGKQHRGTWLKALMATSGEDGPKRQAAYAALRMNDIRAAYAARSTAGASPGSSSPWQGFDAGRPLTSAALATLVREAIAGRDVDRRSLATGDTLLHLAVEDRHHELVQQLAAAGARRNIRNNKGVTASEAAYARGVTIPVPNAGSD